MFDSATNSVSLWGGDECCDVDSWTLETFDAANTSLGLVASGDWKGNPYTQLSISAAVIASFVARWTGMTAGIAWDDLEFVPAKVPEPGAVALMGLGSRGAWPGPRTRGGLDALNTRDRIGKRYLAPAIAARADGRELLAVLEQIGEGAEVDHARAYRRPRRASQAEQPAQKCQTFLHTQRCMTPFGSARARKFLIGRGLLALA